MERPVVWWAPCPTPLLISLLRPERLHRTEDALILTLSRLRCADPCRTGVPVGVGSGDGRGLTQVWGSAREGTWEQAVADGRRVGATRRILCEILHLGLPLVLLTL